MNLNRTEILYRLNLPDDDYDRIRISNLDYRCVRQNGIDLRVAPTAKYITENQEPFFLGVEKPESTHAEYAKEGNWFHLKPDEYLLLHSLQEIVYWPKTLMADISMRSTNHRSGVDLNHSGVVETGYTGPLSWGATTQLKNGVKILPGLRMVQMVISHVTPMSKADMYGTNASKYTEKGFEAKPEEEVEADILRSGDLEKLLETFKFPNQE